MCKCILIAGKSFGHGHHIFVLIEFIVVSIFFLWSDLEGFGCFLSSCTFTCFTFLGVATARHSSEADTIQDSTTVPTVPWPH